MTLSITGKQMDVGQSLMEHTKNAVEHLIHRYIGDVNESHVVFSKEHPFFHAEIKVYINHNFVVHCKGHDEDPYKALAHAMEKLEARIRKFKDRLKTKKRQKMDSFESTQYLIDASYEDDSSKDVPLTIAELKDNIERLTVSEAVMQLELSQSPVVVFKNASHDRVNVVYRRTDGHIGWIDPK